MKKIIKIAGLISLIFVSIVLIVNFIVVLSTKGQLKNDSSKKTDCILVLGAGVKPDGTPSKMLKDRLDKGIELYKKGVASKILLSGDNGTVEYNEVKAMATYIKNGGVPGEDIFLDHAGFSTYESIYRARDVFKVKKCTVVTQRYHEYRTLYIANRLGVEAEGIPAKNERYGGQFLRDLREVLARDKDFVKCITKPKPTYLGEPIDIKGSGKRTW